MVYRKWLTFYSIWILHRFIVVLESEFSTGLLLYSSEFSTGLLLDSRVNSPPVYCCTRVNSLPVYCWTREWILYRFIVGLESEFSTGLLLDSRVNSPPVYCWTRVTQSLVLYVALCPFCLFSFNNWILCPSSIYDFWWPLLYLHTFLTQHNFRVEHESVT
jgi:hypothetical protein